MLGILDNQMGISLINRFKTVVPGIAMANQDVIFCPMELAKRFRAERRGTDELEFINFYRGAPVFSWERNSTFAAREGLDTHISSPDAYSGSVVHGKKGVAADITYEIGYWTRDKKNCNAFLEQYTFWIFESPVLPFIVERANIEHQLYMHFDPPIEEVKDWFQEGKYFVIHADIRVEAWIYKDLPVEPKIDKIIFDLNLTGPQGDVHVSTTEITV